MTLKEAYDSVVAVVAIDKASGTIRTVTSCDKKDAQKYARFYRRVGYNAKVLTYEELDKLQEKERRERYERV